jgi:hypothetical protein
MNERTIQELQSWRNDVARRFESYAGGDRAQSPPAALMRELADAERALSEAREKAAQEMPKLKYKDITDDEHAAVFRIRRATVDLPADERRGSPTDLITNLSSAIVAELRRARAVEATELRAQLADAHMMADHRGYELEAAESKLADLRSDHASGLQELAGELGDQTTPDAELPALAAKMFRAMKAAARRAETENEELHAEVATKQREADDYRAKEAAALDIARAADKEIHALNAGLDEIRDLLGADCSRFAVAPLAARLLRERAAEITRLHAELTRSRVTPSVALPDAPIPLRLPCPRCHELHLDHGELAAKPHHTHACQACGEVWRPAIVSTVGVRFLPGFKDEPRENES